MEDDYEEPQILLDMALKDCSNSNVKEIWEVKHLQSTTNWSLILDDGTHYCTCLYLIYAGFVYRHFFAVILQSKIAQFNIKLVPSRWYSEEGLVSIEKINEKSIYLIQNKEQHTGTFHMINIIRGQDVYSGSVKDLDSKKELYGRGIGLCKKALTLAIENKSNQAFEELVKQFIKNQTNTLSLQNGISVDNINNESEILSIADPSNKRYLSAIENTKRSESDSKDDKSLDLGRKRNKRKCGICKSWYHDSRNCPEKNRNEMEIDKEN